MTEHRPHLTELIRENVRSFCGQGVGRRWVVAVSGGSDSVALLRLLHEIRIEEDLELIVAHLDHGTRGEAGKADAQFVEDLARNLNLAFALGHWKPERATHFEADARAARYHWLVELAVARQAQSVAVGHTLDDQAETVLHRILRGTGLRGLSGIPARRKLSPDIDLIRPLLEMRRTELQAYLAEIGQPFRTDATNFDLSRTRSRLRGDLIPRIEQEYNPNVAEALTRLAELARAAVQNQARLVLRFEQRVVVERTEEGLVLDRGPFLTGSAQLQTELLRRLWRSQGWPERSMSARHWRSLAEFAQRSAGTLHLPSGVRFTVQEGQLLLTRSTNPTPSQGHAEQPPSLDGLIVTPNPDNTCTEIIDADSVQLPLTVAHPRPGDRFDPLGMGGRSMPLADFLRGRGLKRADRAQVVVVKDVRGIIWVVGHRISHRVRLTEQTRNRLGLGWRKE